MNDFHKIALQNIVSFKTGKLNSNAAKADGRYPFFTCSQEVYKTDTYSFDTECVLLGGNNANGIYPINYFKGKFDAYQRTYVIQSLDEKTVINKWIFYALKLKLEKLRTISTGATTKFLTLTILNTIEIPLPPIDVQNKIAVLLSAYDNLVENNNRRIAILEEMAQKLYREWFVHFRFPGHENVKMVESEIGLIPEDWATVQLKELCTKIFSGGTPTTTIEEYWNGGLPWLSSGETREGYITSTEKTITSKGAQNSSTRHASKFDVVVASAGQGKTRGQTSLLLLDTYINQSVIAISAIESYNTYVYYNIKGRYDELRHISDSSSIRGSLTAQIFNGLEIVKPSKDLAKLFQQLTLPYIKQIELLILKNTNLRKTRDLLLPRLISGDIDVSKLDIPTKEG